MSAQTNHHFDLLRLQIDSGKVEFSVFLQQLGTPPTNDDYRAAVRYAHERFRERFDYVVWMYERIDRARQQTLLNTAHSEGRLLHVEDLLAVNVARVSAESLGISPNLEVWVHDAKKGALQVEITAAVEAKRRIGLERDQLFKVWEDATRAEKASRPAESAR